MSKLKRQQQVLIVHVHSERELRELNNMLLDGWDVVFEPVSVGSGNIVFVLQGRLRVEESSDRG